MDRGRSRTRICGFRGGLDPKCVGIRLSNACRELRRTHDASDHASALPLALLSHLHWSGLGRSTGGLLYVERYCIVVSAPAKARPVDGLITLKQLSADSRAPGEDNIGELSSQGNSSIPPISILKVLDAMVPRQIAPTNAILAANGKRWPEKNSEHSKVESRLQETDNLALVIWPSFLICMYSQS